MIYMNFTRSSFFAMERLWAFKFILYIFFIFLFYFVFILLLFIYFIFFQRADS